MLRLMKFAVMALVAVTLTTPASARPPEWVELGTHTVKLLETDDEIKVGRDDGVFTRIRFEVNGNDLDIRDIRVRFINGEEQVIRIDQKIREGRASPEFDLAGRRRGIQSIYLRYNGRPLFGGKSRIKVFGLRTDFDAPPPPPPPMAGRPKVLDNQVVDSRSDRIDFDVGREDGMISQIRLRSVDGPLLYRAIEITFANGQTQVVEGIERLEPGEQGKAIDLAGDRRFIRKVTVYKRPSWRQGDSRVELLGLVEPRPAPPPPPPPRPSPPSAGYESLDVQTVDRQSDTIVFRPRRPVPVDQVIIRAVDEPLTFRNVTVAFNNGQSQSFDAIERLEPGQSSRPYDVRGDRRLVTEVVVQKRPSFRPGLGRAELLAKLAPLPPPPPPPPSRPSGPPSHGFPPGWVLLTSGNLAAGKSPPPRPFNPVCMSRPNAPGCNVPLTALPSLVTLPVGRDVGQFKRIGLRMTGGDLQIRGLTVVYASGERDSIPLSVSLTNKGRTQPIELRGERFIREIQIDYVKSTLNRSTVEIYGDYVDSWLGERGRRRDYNQGWVLLGSQRAEMFSNDTDAFQIGERFGAFRAVRFSVRDHAVRFYGMRIVYGNGQTEDVPFSGELTSGQSTPPLNLTGRQRYIDRIEVKYRTKLNFQGEGVVEVWGQQ